MFPFANLPVHSRRIAAEAFPAVSCNLLTENLFSPTSFGGQRSSEDLSVEFFFYRYFDFIGFVVGIVQFVLAQPGIESF